VPILASISFVTVSAIDEPVEEGCGLFEVWDEASQQCVAPSPTTSLEPSPTPGATIGSNEIKPAPPLFTPTRSIENESITSDPNEILDPQIKASPGEIHYKGPFVQLLLLTCLGYPEGAWDVDQIAHTVCPGGGNVPSYSEVDNGTTTTIRIWEPLAFGYDVPLSNCEVEGAGQYDNSLLALKKRQSVDLTVPNEILDDLGITCYWFSVQRVYQDGVGGNVTPPATISYLEFVTVLCPAGATDPSACSPAPTDYRAAEHIGVAVNGTVVLRWSGATVRAQPIPFGTISVTTPSGPTSLPMTCATIDGTELEVTPVTGGFQFQPASGTPIICTWFEVAS
jgi:hypothetical protein